MSSTLPPASHRDPGEDFGTLTELFARMIEAQRSQILNSEDAWMNDAQILAVKLFKQACSVRLILDPTQLDFRDGSQIVFVDHSSATILTRACLETFIVFHWIFQSQE